MSKPVYATLTLRLRGDEPGDDTYEDDWVEAAFEAAEETLRELARGRGFEVEAVIS